MTLRQSACSASRPSDLNIILPTREVGTDEFVDKPPLQSELAACAAGALPTDPGNSSA
jgi:hypothetical protein